MSADIPVLFQAGDHRVALIKVKKQVLFYCNTMFYIDCSIGEIKDRVRQNVENRFFEHEV